MIEAGHRGAITRERCRDWAVDTRDVDAPVTRCGRIPVSQGTAVASPVGRRMTDSASVALSTCAITRECACQARRPASSPFHGNGPEQRKFSPLEVRRTKSPEHPSQPQACESRGSHAARRAFAMYLSKSAT